MTLHVAQCAPFGGYGSNLDPPSPCWAREGRLFNVVLPRVQTERSRSGSGGTMGETRRSCHQAKAANRSELALEIAAIKEAVEALNGLFKTTSCDVVAHHSGLTVGGLCLMAG